MEKKKFIKNIQIDKKGLDDDSFVLHTLFAIFCKMKQQGYDEISLKASDVSKYAPKLETMFTDLGIISDAFGKTPVDETYDKFKNYVIQCLIGNNYGYFNAKYDEITFRINPYLVQKVLKENEDIIDIIENGYLCITNQMEDTIPSNQFSKHT